jgi:hypothetical protein
MIFTLSVNSAEFVERVTRALSNFESLLYADCSMTIYTGEVCAIGVYFLVFLKNNTFPVLSGYSYIGWIQRDRDRKAIKR